MHEYDRGNPRNNGRLSQRSTHELNLDHSLGHSRHKLYQNRSSEHSSSNLNQSHSFDRSGSGSNQGHAIEQAELDLSAEWAAQENKPRMHSVPRTNKAAWIVAILAGLLVVGVLVLFLHLLASGSPALTSEEHPSTAQEEWQKGTVPALYQFDSEWADYSYAGGRFAETGCGPICLTMVYISLTGDTKVSPTAIADLATTGGFASSAGTDWLFMIAGAEELGLEVEQCVLSEELLQECLAAGMPVICIMGEGDFTSSGHFIVITGRADDGTYQVRDSNSIERTKQTWSFEQLYSQHLGAWVYWVV